MGGELSFTSSGFGVRGLVVGFVALSGVFLVLFDTCSSVDRADGEAAHGELPAWPPTVSALGLTEADAWPSWFPLVGDLGCYPRGVTRPSSGRSGRWFSFTFHCPFSFEPVCRGSLQSPHKLSRDCFSP